MAAMHFFFSISNTHRGEIEKVKNLGLFCFLRGKRQSMWKIGTTVLWIHIISFAFYAIVKRFHKLKDLYDSFYVSFTCFIWKVVLVFLLLYAQETSMFLNMDENYSTESNLVLLLSFETKCWNLGSQVFFYTLSLIFSCLSFCYNNLSHFRS